MTTQQHHLPTAEAAVQQAAREIAAVPMPRGGRSAAIPDRHAVGAGLRTRPNTGARLNESDALLWNIECDPCLRSTIVAVSLLDGTPDWASLRDRVLAACQQVPRLRQKVVETPGRLAPPSWQFDEHFDIDYHLRRAVVPSPGDVRAVLDMAGPMAMTAFDKDRPLWEFTLVEGLDGGRSAFVQKVHHSFTDGVGGVKLTQLLLDDIVEGAEGRRRDPLPASPAGSRANRTVAPDRTAGRLVAAISSVASEVRLTAAFSVRSMMAAPGLASHAIQHPTQLIGQTVRSVQSVAKLLAPVSTPLSTVMTERGMARRLDQFDVPLDALLAAAHAAGSSLNDAFLAGISGGMRRYHDHHGAPVDALRVTMPINVRRAGDALGSNHFVPARIVIPISTVDAADRMRELGVLATAWRREPALSFSDVIAGALNRLPITATTSIFGGMLKAVDLVATNVPGIHQRVALSGVEVIREYGFAPPSGAAFSIALLSHGPTCCIGVNIDTEAVGDPDVLVRCLVDGFAEVLAVGSGAVR